MKPDNKTTEQKLRHQKSFREILREEIKYQLSREGHEGETITVNTVQLEALLDDVEKTEAKTVPGELIIYVERYVDHGIGEGRVAVVEPSDWPCKAYTVEVHGAPTQESGSNCLEEDRACSRPNYCDHHKAQMEQDSAPDVAKDPQRHPCDACKHLDRTCVLDPNEHGPCDKYLQHEAEPQRETVPEVYLALDDDYNSAAIQAVYPTRKAAKADRPGSKIVGPFFIHGAPAAKDEECNGSLCGGLPRCPVCGCARDHHGSLTTEAQPTTMQVLLDIARNMHTYAASASDSRPLTREGVQGWAEEISTLILGAPTRDSAPTAKDPQRETVHLVARADDEDTEVFASLPAAVERAKELNGTGWECEVESVAVYGAPDNTGENTTKLCGHNIDVDDCPHCCPSCSGTGEIQCVCEEGDGSAPPVTTRCDECDECDGDGRYDCGDCGGSGRID